MKLVIKGDVSDFYLQTLCLLFYPGSKFSEKENAADDGITVSASMTEDGTGCFAEIEISDSSGVYKGSSHVDRSDGLSRPEMIKKIALGRAFLEAGERATGIRPPWGLLTGVRPSKLARWSIESGLDESEAADALVRDYSVTREKAKLAASVASAELSLLKRDLYDKCSVYIAIPFCPTRCSYCSFVSYTSERLLSLIPEYLEVLMGEIKRTSRLIASLGKKVSTVYIGGGTPTTLDSEQLTRLLSCVAESFDTRSLDEFTLEAGRPDTIDREKARAAYSCGVSRVSVNTQTLNADVLQRIGRRHTPDDFFRAYSDVRCAGIENVNVDLIAGLPGESYDSFVSSLSGIEPLRPENITVHAFCVKKSAELKSENVYAPKSRDAEKSVSYAADHLGERGYIPYYMYRQKNAVSNLENVGYSLPGHEGLYNVLMMEEVQSIFAIGASAVTKLVRWEDGNCVIKRTAENKYPFEYLRDKASADSRARREKETIDFFTQNTN
ncbi:MAG: coproporphyrinogen dehydrogenase HemZ [Clostridia bacterium]|nr:coproporphyrinogen dehydrogenase HemZ [Clostridia bacterium]